MRCGSHVFDLSEEEARQLEADLATARSQLAKMREPKIKYENKTFDLKSDNTVKDWKDHNIDPDPELTAKIKAGLDLWNNFDLKSNDLKDQFDLKIE